MVASAYKRLRSHGKEGVSGSSPEEGSAKATIAHWPAAMPRKGSAVSLGRTRGRTLPSDMSSARYHGF